MATATRCEIFDVSAQKIYQTIINYADYTEFVDGVTAIEVLEQSETSALVEYSLKLIKKFKYRLKLTQIKDKEVSWSFDGGDIFKKNEGSWKLKDLGDSKTEVTYSVDVDIKGFVPKKIIDMLTVKNLPNMMDAFLNRSKLE